MFKKALGMALVIVGLTYLASAQIYSANDHIVINEVQIEGVGSADDFIELYNPTESEINLGDYRLVKRTESGTSDSSIKAFENGDVIAAHGYYLWANSGGSYTLEADSTTGATISANNGIALRNGAMDTGEIVDSVGWGSATNEFVEMAAFAENPQANMSMERSGDDTDNNSVDFVLNESPTPQTSQTSETPTPSPAESPSPSPTETATPTPTPSETPTPTPTVTPSPSPSESPTPSPTTTPTPTPLSNLRILGMFGFGSQRQVCYLQYEIKRIGFMKVRFPSMKCIAY